MRTHTPPPWTVEYFSAYDYYDVTWGPPNDPRERFSILEELSSEDAHLIAAAPDLLALAIAYEGWEADMILCQEAWQGGRADLPTLTDKLWDRLMEIQEMRNNAVAKARGK